MEGFFSPERRLVSDRCTDSILAISVIVLGDHTGEPYFGRDRTQVTKASSDVVQSLE